MATPGPALESDGKEGEGGVVSILLGAPRCSLGLFSVSQFVLFPAGQAGGGNDCQQVCPGHLAMQDSHPEGVPALTQARPPGHDLCW